MIFNELVDAIAMISFILYFILFVCNKYYTMRELIFQDVVAHFFIANPSQDIRGCMLCKNSRLVEGFHPLFHESMVAPLFVGVCGCFVVACGCFWVFVGVRGGTIWHYLAQTCPWDHLARRKKKICCLIKNDREAATFVNLIFRNFG